MNRINLRTYSDGFYELSTYVNGHRIAVMYSDKTLGNDAMADFRKVIQREMAADKAGAENKP